MTREQEILAAAEEMKARVESQARAAVDKGDVATLEQLSKKYFEIIARIKSLTENVHCL